MKYNNILELFLLLLIPLSSKAADCKTLEKDILKLISNKNADIGIGIIINSKDTIQINNDQRYPMMSVFKFHQAFAISKYLEQNKIPLDSTLFISKHQLDPNTYSPLYKEIPETGKDISIKELIEYSLQKSDNNACDILFNNILNTEKTDSIIRNTGINRFSIKYTEHEMKNDKDLCYHNWSSPLASTELLNSLISSDFTSNNYKDFIIKTMTGCKTGINRIPGQLQNTRCIIGHKTGTGDKNDEEKYIAINDIGFVFMPNGNRFCISIFIKEYNQDIKSGELIIAKISKAIYEYMIKQ